MIRRLAVLLLSTSLLAGCDEESKGKPAPPVQAPNRDVPRGAARGANAAPDATSANGITRRAFAKLVTDLSEKGEYFFSDNVISNETSYLQPAELLRERAAPSGAYLGVGPEQNFTYIALTRPRLAFIVDIRRDNLLLHLLYKAIFERSRSRSHFLTLLLGRPWDQATDPGPSASLDAVIAHAERRAPSAEHHAKLHRALVSAIADDFHVALSDDGRKKLDAIHRAFFDGQLDIEFELHEENGRDYPSLERLLRTTSQSGIGSFLSTGEAFRTVRDLQRENAVIPVVGDFAGEHALRGIAESLKRRDLPVSVFYVSNVEQYLIDDDAKWARWMANTKALPSSEKSLFLRAYLDQGQRHPQQMKGHRTASVLQTFDHFRWSQVKQRYTSYHRVTVDGALTDEE